MSCWGLVLAPGLSEQRYAVLCLSHLVCNPAVPEFFSAVATWSLHESWPCRTHLFIIPLPLLTSSPGQGMAWNSLVFLITVRLHPARDSDLTKATLERVAIIREALSFSYDGQQCHQEQTLCERGWELTTREKACCRSWVSLAVRKHHNQKQLEGERVCSANRLHSITGEPSQKLRAGTWSQELNKRAQGRVAYQLSGLLICFPIHSGLDPSIPIITSRKHPLRTCLRATWKKAYSQLKFLCSDNSSLCRVDKNKSNRSVPKW